MKQTGQWRVCVQLSCERSHPFPPQRSGAHRSSSELRQRMLSVHRAQVVGTECVGLNGRSRLSDSETRPTGGSAFHAIRLPCVAQHTRTSTTQRAVGHPPHHLLHCPPVHAALSRQPCCLLCLSPLSLLSLSRFLSLSLSLCPSPPSPLHPALRCSLVPCPRPTTWGLAGLPRCPSLPCPCSVCSA